MGESAAPAMSALGRALGERVGRADPRTLPTPYLVGVVACWLLTLLVAVVVLVPGLSDGIEGAVLGLRVLVVATLAALAGTAALLLRRDDVPRALREVAHAGVAGAPTLLLAADRLAAFAVIAAVLFVLAEGAAHRRRTPPLLLALLVASGWLVLLAAQFTPGAGRGATWIALFGVAAAFAAFGSYYAVARAAESRVGWMRPVFRDDLRPLVVAAVVVPAVALTVLRLTIARELFPDPDPRLWSPLDTAPTSWLHAVGVAALVVGFAARSVRRPLRRSGERGITAALAVAGNAHLALAVLVLVAGLVLAAATGRFAEFDIPPLLVAALKFAGVVVITVVALLPPFRGTTARAIAVVTGGYLLPLTLVGLLGQAGVALPGMLAGLPATPVQVALPLLLVAVAGAALPPLRRMLGTGLVVRLAVVPLVAVHAGWLLPAAWSELGRLVLVVGVVVGLLFLLPRAAADPDRRGREVLASSAGQLLVLVLFVLALPSLLDDPQLVVLGLFWLSVAVIAALTVRAETPRDDQLAGSSAASTSAYSATRSRKSASLGP
jgi:hypothetical protein